MQMVLDNRTYDQLAGKWRDLFTRLKWDIIKSVLKSLGGFQAKKVKVRWGIVNIYIPHLDHSSQILLPFAATNSVTRLGWTTARGQETLIEFCLCQRNAHDFVVTTTRLQRMDVRELPSSCQDTVLIAFPAPKRRPGRGIQLQNLNTTS